MEYKNAKICNTEAMNLYLITYEHKKSVQNVFQIALSKMVLDKESKDTVVKIAKKYSKTNVDLKGKTLTYTNNICLRVKRLKIYLNKKLIQSDQYRRN